MEEVQVGVIYNTRLGSNEGDLSPHASQTIYFSNINANKISDRETPLELLSLEPQYGTEPLLKSYISIIRHSEESSCCSPLYNLSYCTSRNLRASTSVELDALRAFSNRNLNMEPSVLMIYLCFNIRISYQSMNDNKTALRPPYLNSGISCYGKIDFFYWIRFLVSIFVVFGIDFISFQIRPKLITKIKMGVLNVFECRMLSCVVK